MSKKSVFNNLIAVVRTIGYNFSAFKIRGIRIYMTGQIFNLLGDWMQQTAQAWLVWELTHKATALGIVAFLSQFMVSLGASNVFVSFAWSCPGANARSNTGKNCKYFYDDHLWFTACCILARRNGRRSFRYTYDHGGKRIADDYSDDHITQPSIIK